LREPVNRSISAGLKVDAHIRLNETTGICDEKDLVCM